MTRAGQTTPSGVNWQNLPKPEDDGGAKHLSGMALPNVTLPATDGTKIDLAALKGRTVVFIFPKTGRPDRPAPDNWNMIPGAKGCTLQACSYRDLSADLKAQGVDHIFGLSTQSTEDQQETAQRLHLPFPLLSDLKLDLTLAANLPTMAVEGTPMIRRLTMVLRDGVVEKVWYPVFPPDENASQVFEWLNA